MRDSDVALGGLVLLGVGAALLYLLFPHLITTLLRGPSYTTIIQKQRSAIAAFEQEGLTIESYLRDSWTMKAYRRLERLIGRDGSADWAEIIRERKKVAVSLVEYLERQRPMLDQINRSLELRLALRVKTKRGFVDFTKTALDGEIETLQSELDRRTAELSAQFAVFAERRRSLNRKALLEWFKRSLLISLSLAGIVAASFGIGLAAHTWLVRPGAHSKQPKILGNHSVIQGRNGFLGSHSSPVRSDTTFDFNIRLTAGPIPAPIATILAQLPATRTAAKLTAILGGYPETPASRSHHLHEFGGLIEHTAKVLAHSAELLPMLPDPRIGPVVILAHDIGKILTLTSNHGGQPHDIASADIVASLPELRGEFDAVTARSIILAIRHQYSKAEIPLNAPPLAETILQFIKKADLAAAAEESREAAGIMKGLAGKVLEAFPSIVSELNVNGWMGGKAQGYLSQGYLFLLKEPLKAKLLQHLGTQNAPVFKGQDPVWNEMAIALAGAGMITTKALAKQAGKKSCLFTIKTSQGRERVIAIPVANLAPQMTNQWLQTAVPEIEVL